MFCNGTPLPGYALEERLKVLNNVVTEKYGYLNLLGREEKKTTDDVIEALDHAIQIRLVFHACTTLSCSSSKQLVKKALS